MDLCRLTGALIDSLFSYLTVQGGYLAERGGEGVNCNIRMGPDGYGKPRPGLILRSMTYVLLAG